MFNCLQHYDFFVPSHLEPWEVLGLREWANRVKKIETQAVAWYIAHRLTPPVSAYFQRYLVSFHPYIQVYNTGDCTPLVFDQSGSEYMLTFLAALHAQDHYNIYYQFVDSLVSTIPQTADMRALILDQERVRTGRVRALEGRRAVTVNCRYTQTIWQTNDDITNCHKLIQIGSEIIHQYFKASYVKTFRQILPPERIEEIKQIMAARTSLKDATVRESNDIDLTTRKTKLGWLKLSNYEDLAEVIYQKVNEALPLVAPQFADIGELVIPSVQFTVYQPGDFYNWHQDGSDLGHSFSRRCVSLVLILQDAEKGGEFQIENMDGGWKLRVGDLVIFPSYKRHRVTKVTKGKRFSLVIWLEVPNHQGPLTQEKNPRNRSKVHL